MTLAMLFSIYTIIFHCFTDRREIGSKFLNLAGPMYLSDEKDQRDCSVEMPLGVAVAYAVEAFCNSTMNLHLCVKWVHIVSKRICTIVPTTYIAILTI